MAAISIGRWATLLADITTKAFVKHMTQLIYGMFQASWIHTEYRFYYYHNSYRRILLLERI